VQSVINVFGPLGVIPRGSIYRAVMGQFTLSKQPLTALRIYRGPIPYVLRATGYDTTNLDMTLFPPAAND
jgi:hypothetical protein